MLFQRHVPTPTAEQALAWLENEADADLRRDPAHALAAGDAALRLGAERLGRSAAARLQALRSLALIELKRFDEAVAASAIAEELGPLEPRAHAARANACFRGALFDDAATAARTLVAATPGDPRAWHLLGRIELWLHDSPEAADRSFARAAALAPRYFVVPHRVSAEEFDALAADAVAAIPASFATALDNVMIRAFLLPPRDEVSRGLAPDLLGLYTGATVAARVPAFPARVALYQRNIETFSGSAAALAAQVHRVVMHEIGHHFAMDHDELGAAGL